jgi:hypothetical protein
MMLKTFKGVAPVSKRGRHSVDTGRQHGHGALRLSVQRHEPSTSPGGPTHVSHGMPKSAISGREDTGEGLQNFTKFTDIDRMARNNLTDKFGGALGPTIPDERGPEDYSNDYY